MMMWTWNGISGPMNVILWTNTISETFKFNRANLFVNKWNKVSENKIENSKNSHLT